MCHLFDREMWWDRWMTLRAAEKYSDWPWFGGCLLGAWRKVWRHLYLHLHGVCAR